jgi:hypothetical protein
MLYIKRRFSYRRETINKTNLMDSISTRDRYDSFTLKIFYNGKTKRCALPQNFKEMKSLINLSFPLDELGDGFYNISYMDEDNDYIFIENEFDWSNAISFLEDSGKKLLKVIVIRNLEKTMSENMLSSSRNKSDLTFNHVVKQQSPQLQRILRHEKIIPQEEEIKKMEFNDKIEVLEQSEIIETSEKIKENDYSLNNISIDQFINKNSTNIFNIPKLNLNFDFNTSQDMRSILKLSLCTTCGRKFNESSIHKHSKICSKLSNSHRSPFVSKKQRILNLEHFFLMRKGVTDRICRDRIDPIINPFKYLFCNTNSVKKLEDKYNWRNKSRHLRNSIKIQKLLRLN